MLKRIYVSSHGLYVSISINENAKHAQREEKRSSLAVA